MSCGLEAFYNIDYIPEGSFTDTSARIQLPPSSADGYSTYFRNFVIFYRIYISDVNTFAKIDTSDLRTSINPTLNSDFTSFFPYTDITNPNAITSNLENTFFNRRYFQLGLEGGDIANVLGGGSLGRNLEFAFPGNNRSTLTINGTEYVLQRTDGSESPGIIFKPTPDNLYFLNHPDLYAAANATNDINADVATSNRADALYTYVSMYIAATGKSLEMPPRTIFSPPTHIGIFRLADWRG
jgi:hypothetical protein